MRPICAPVNVLTVKHFDLFFSSYLAFVFVFVFVFAFVSVFVFWFALSLADVCTVQFSDSQTPNPFLYNGSFESLSFFAFWSCETDSNICMSTGHCPASSVQKCWLEARNKIRV